MEDHDYSQLGLLDVLDLGEPSRPRSDTLERPHINGALPKPSFVAYERDLTEADIAALDLPRGVAPRALARIHSSHHSLARCLAADMKPAQAALVTGYSTGRISQLQKDEAFASLVQDYRAEAKSVFANLAERMADLSFDAIEILHERLHENPEGFTIPVLLDVIKSFADRTGHGPNQEVSLKLSTDLIDRPPRETYEEWKARRDKELVTSGEEMKKLN
jgi:hypothetical protein